MEYLLPLLSIIMINILLSGDNALVIALASRKLGPKQQQSAMLFGSIGAIGLRIILTFIAVFILKIPYLQILGGVLLLWIAIKLIVDHHQHEKIEAKKNLWDAIKTIIIADIIMSLDNVIAIIGIAKGNISLLVIGLIISIPMIIWGSKFIGILIQKWPILIVVGSIFLGWTAGEMVISDNQIIQIVERNYWLKMVVPSVFAVIVVITGSWMVNFHKRLKRKK
ncbi:TerC family protein [Pelosinus sp. sgz500959]|uniref:TerC family protein n=1 Tax=Pelosinus sp. sgz500959 TaxID=3242472 RepID=UPI00366B413D